MLEAGLTHGSPEAALGSLDAPNQLWEQVVGMGDNQNPFKVFTSAARSQMTNKFYGQALRVRGAEARRFFTGAEAEAGKYDFGAKIPAGSQILKVIPKYIKGIGRGGVKHNPSTLVIYENVHTGIVNSVMVDKFHTSHKTFGFKYNINKFQVQDYFEEETSLSKTPAVNRDGQYCYGVEANMAFMSIPAVTEDGVVISESFSKRIATDIIGNRVVSWGSKYYPLNLYGDDENYKPFPDIGDKIHPSGLVMCLRAFDPFFDVVNLTPKALRFDGIDYDSDRPVFGEPNAEVIDLTVIRNPRVDYSRIPSGMNVQTDMYHEQLIKYYDSIYSFYTEERKKRGKGLRLGEALQRELVEAYSQTQMRSGGRGNRENKRIKYMYNKTALDDVRVDIKYMKTVRPKNGYKLTGCHGNKAVVCSVWADDRMPTDSAGNRADVIMDDVSILKRLNIGVMYEQFFNAVCRDTLPEIRSLFENQGMEAAWARIMELYSIISPPMHKIMLEEMTDVKDKTNHVREVLKSGFYIYLPPWSPSLCSTTVRKLRNSFPLVYGPVDYTGDSGKKVTTKKPVLIASNYIMVLNKIGDLWSAVTGSKTQHHGVLAKLNTGDRDLTPGRQNPVKIAGESEVRLFVGTIGPMAASELMDRSNCPESNKAVCRGIISAENPSSIEVAVDREEVPLGNNRAIRFVQHIFNSAGINITDDTLKDEADNK